MADQVNYNDGKWHGWNGGECPVHPKSEVEVRFRGYAKEYYLCDRRDAGGWAWRHDDSNYDIIAFRVIKEHKEPPKPREWWVSEYGWGLGEFFTSKAEADENRAVGRIRCIHLREVID